MGTFTQLLMIKLSKISDVEQEKLDLVKDFFKIKSNAGAVRKLIKHGEIKI